MKENEKIKTEVNSNSVNEQNNNSENKPRNKKLTIVLISLIIVLILAIGVCAGLWLAGDTTKTINNKEELVEEEEKNTSKKIDETKPWVYDADYGKDKENKIVDNYYNFCKDVSVPYININSKDAEKINNEIKNIYEEVYSKFGSIESETYNGVISNVQTIYKVEYQYYENEDILSVVITTRDGVLNGCLSRDYVIYNFNLNTLEKASLEDIYKECGFVSKEEFEDATEITIANEITAGNLFNDVSWNYNQYYMDKNIDFNLIVPSPSGNPSPIIVKKGVTKIETTNNEIVNSNSQETDNSSLSNILDNQEIFKCEYFKVVLPTSWEGKYRVEYEEQGNTKDYMFVESEHREVLFTITISDKNLEGSAYPFTTLYETNGNLNYYVAKRGDAPVYLEPITSMLEDFSGVEYNLYVKKTLTNVYGDCTKNINVYGRQFIPITGTTGRENIYYINENSELCKTNLVDLSTQILASYVKDIQIDQNNIIHAYPIGDSFMNNIAMEDDYVKYENIN